MEIDFGTIPTLIGLALVLFVIYTLLYYKYIYSIIDPLFVFVFTTAFASVLAIQVIPDISDILHFFGCQLALWIGFVVVYRLSAQFDSTDSQESEYSFSDQALLCWTTYSLLIVYVLSNLIVGYVKGFALLSDEPTVSKIANFQQGFGLFRKINWSTGAFAVTGLIYLYLVRRRKIDLFLVGIVVFFSSLEGSKSALLQIAVSIGIVLYHPFFLKQRSILEKFKRFVPILLII
jgi:hypothetical protein